MSGIFHFENEAQAILSQIDLSRMVVSSDQPGFNPRLVCGMDASYFEETAFVAAVVWDADRKLPVEKVGWEDKAPTEYVPGLFGYREGPLLVGVLQELHSTPDVFLIDGHGVAHPRRFGLASQFGLAIDRPTIGVAKSLLYGRSENGAILDSEDYQIGATIFLDSGRKLFVSIGHKISLRTACQVVHACLVNGQLAPLRLAHFESARLRRREQS